MPETVMSRCDLIGLKEKAAMQIKSIELHQKKLAAEKEAWMSKKEYTDICRLALGAISEKDAKAEGIKVGIQWLLSQISVWRQ